MTNRSIHSTVLFYKSLQIFIYCLLGIEVHYFPFLNSGSMSLTVSVRKENKSLKK